MGEKTLIEQVQDLAETKRHHVAARLVNGEVDLTDQAAEAILAHLDKCQDLPNADQIRARQIRARQAARQAPAAPDKAAPKDVPPPLIFFKGKVPGGYYATPHDGSDVIDFWLVEVSEKKDQWEGYSFVRRVLGGQPKGARKLRTEKITSMQQRLALKAILGYGLDKSQTLFVDKLDRCIDCSTPLTNDVSRGRHRGPDCYEKFVSGAR